jgi:hypothetical protein
MGELLGVGRIAGIIEQSQPVADPGVQQLARTLGVVSLVRLYLRQGLGYVPCRRELKRLEEVGFRLGYLRAFQERRPEQCQQIPDQRLVLLRPIVLPR